MKLKRFKVTNFRSVSDSGWVEFNDVTALIGINESGKTNLLLPLWKLNPAREGDIQPTSDYPKGMFGAIKKAPEKYCFITAEFETADLVDQIAEAADIDHEMAAVVQVSRLFDGSYRVVFPEYEPAKSVAGSWLDTLVSQCDDEVDTAKELKQERDLKHRLTAALRNIDCRPAGTIATEELRSVKETLAALVPKKPAKTSAIVPLLQQLIKKLDDRLNRLNTVPPSKSRDVRNIVIKALPPFVYYSHYGNLDAEIYLPHVIDNLERDDLGAKEEAKTRTLRVLFRFVDLEPQEILRLGEESLNSDQEEIERVTEQKRERSILLQSAGTRLTDRFRKWWRQGNHRFRFEADGNHFRIWVADDLRPTEVELENRSSGLQWFLSFFLIFLAEREDQHMNAVLLLDEPGMSLHPIAQRDLSNFFERLSSDNQIIYTSHSPFLVDADHLERVRKVFVDSDGTTKASSDLRSAAKHEQADAAYAVHSALNLRVAESLLLGCQTVLVEGVSDQYYFTAIKALLLSAGKIAPRRELVFVPSGGAKMVRIIASILTGRDERPPFIVLDSDKPGADAARDLSSGLYANAKDRILSVGDFADVEEAEVEDLLPSEFLAAEIDRMVRDSERPLTDVVDEKKSFVQQVKHWADAPEITLPPHWKVELAKKAKQRALDRGIGHFGDVSDRWTKLFKAFGK